MFVIHDKLIIFQEKCFPSNKTVAALSNEQRLLIPEILFLSDYTLNYHLVTLLKVSQLISYSRFQVKITSSFFKKGLNVTNRTSYFRIKYVSTFLILLHLSVTFNAADHSSFTKSSPHNLRQYFSWLFFLVSKALCFLFSVWRIKIFCCCFCH